MVKQLSSKKKNVKTPFFHFKRKVKLNQNNGLVHLKLNQIWFSFQREKTQLVWFWFSFDIEKIKWFAFGLVLMKKY
jgi:hypothetical protein